MKVKSLICASMGEFKTRLHTPKLKPDVGVVLSSNSK